MRAFAFLLCSSLLLAQAPGKPGVTDPIKDPSQIPGNPNPGPLPRATPQPKPAADESSGAQEKNKKTKKAKKQKSEKSNPSKQ
jgi:hypothetical protein